MKTKARSRILALLLAVVTVLPVGAVLTAKEVEALDTSLYTDYFNECLDFEDLEIEKTVSASYINGKIKNRTLFASSSDGNDSYSPTKWKAVADPKDPENTAIGLVNTGSYAMFRIVDSTKELYKVPYVLGFRLMLNESIGANTTLLGWAHQSGSRMRVLGISGTELRYGSGGGNDNNTATVPGGTFKLQLGRWYEFAVIVEPVTGHMQVEIDGTLIYEFIHEDVVGAKPGYSAINICYGWGSSFNFNAYLDDITFRSLDAEKIKEAAEQKKKEQEAKKALYTIKELEKYQKNFVYLEDDGRLGIPVGLTTYYKGEQSNNDSSVVLYIMNYVGAKKVARGDTMTILNDLLDEGYIVVTLDYQNHPKAVTPNLDWSVHNLRQSMKVHTGGMAFDRYETYIVPDGYMLARNIVFYDIGENGRVGTLEQIVDIYNGSKFRDAKGSKIPNKDEKVTTVDRCLKPDGTPIDLQMKMDIIYPVDTEKPAPMVMISSSAETRMGVCSTNPLRPLDVGPLLRDCAVAIYDHIYTPMARNDHYGYFSGTFSLQGTTGVSSHTSAARAVRYYADKFGYSKEDIAVMGHSKGSYCGLLANPHPELLAEKSTFGSGDGRQTYGEQPFLCYEDGTPIPSNVKVSYRSMGQGNQWRTQYLNGDNAPTMLAVGVQDDSVLLFPDWYPEQKDYEATGIEYLSILMTDVAHTYPHGIDPWYNYDRWDAFMSFLMYHLKETEAPKLLYSSVVNGEVIGDIIVTRHNKAGSKLYESHTVETGSEIFVQFLAPVTEESAKAGITLYDVTAGKQVDVDYRYRGAGNKWYVEPKSDLVKGHKYELRVASTVKSVLNGSSIGEGAVYSFEVK